uniref:Uncharacterized protein C17orf89 n=1 Tax=Heterocephalus glaber TaxID=10181 RepID=A0A0P6JG49_HETGA
MMGGSADWPSNERRKRGPLKWRPPRVPGGSSHVSERSGVAARAEPLPRFPGAPGGLRGRGWGVRQVRAGFHRPGRPPEQGPLCTGVRGPAELLRRCGQEEPEGRLLGRTLGSGPCIYHCRGHRPHMWMVPRTALRAEGSGSSQVLGVPVCFPRQAGPWARQEFVFSSACRRI